MKDEFVNLKSLCKYSDLLIKLCSNIQCARYESFLIKLVYDGYQFYLPAFLDFRGRIYRSGILHFHGRDLARSLIVFAKSNSHSNFNENRCKELFYQFGYSIPFHYQAFETAQEGVSWFLTSMDNNDFSKNIVLARGARHPFQFLANSLALVKDDYDLMTRIPICHDASTSAYQIMSYFLLDKSIAERTNLFPSFDGKIKDIYSFFLDELKVFMKEKAPYQYLTKMVCNLLSRKIVKNIYMPIIYGKTLMSTANDLEDQFSHYITRKDSFQLARVFFEFWKTKYSGIECLIKLIRHIGSVVSARGSPIFYGIPDSFIPLYRIIWF